MFTRRCKAWLQAVKAIKFNETLSKGDHCPALVANTRKIDDDHNESKKPLCFCAPVPLTEEEWSWMISDVPMLAQYHTLLDWHNLRQKVSRIVWHAEEV